MARHTLPDGGALYYEDEGSGPPVVMLHGFTLDGRMWEPQLPALALRFRLVRPDMRGFGRSTPPAEDRPYSHVEDLASLLDALALPAVHIVGLSMGGGVATEFALAYPGRVRSLAYIDPSIDGFDFTVEMPDLSGVARAQGMEAARELWLGSVLFESAMAHPAVAASLRGIVAGYSGVHWLRDGSTEVRPPVPAMTRLREIDVPALVLVGEQDIPDIQRGAERLAAELPRARYTVIAGAGHMANMEAPVEVNRLLEEFLAGLG